MLQFLFTLCDEKYHGQIEYLYTTFYDDMIRFATSKLRVMRRNNPRLDAEDAVQNSFLRISKYIDKVKFSNNERQLKNYLLTVVTHEVIRLVESNSENIDYVEEFCDDSGYDFVEEINIKEQYNAVVKEIERMGDIYGSTLFLAYCEELTVNEIAEMMEVPTKTVYTRLARGKQILRNKMMKGEGTYGY